jgi:alpha-beta hydrolase superfamily lysophospholipase
VSDNWQVFAWDLRGHGRSEGKRGYVNDFSDYCEDQKRFIEFVKSNHHPLGKPLVLFSHSMGGLITMKTLIEHAPQNISALALSSPLNGVSLQIPTWKDKGARFLADWMPKFTLFNEINYADLHRDQELLQEYKADPLRHDKISPRLFVGMLEAMDMVRASAAELRLPVIMQLAGRDKIVSTPASEAVFKKISSSQKLLYIYPDSLHEIFNDLDRDLATKDLKKFLTANT